MEKRESLEGRDPKLTCRWMQYYFGYSIACDLQGNAYVGVGVVADGPFFSWGARSINGTGLGEYSVVAKMADSMLPGKP